MEVAAKPPEATIPPVLPTSLDVHALTAALALAMVVAYMIVTAPFLYLLVKAHGMQRDYLGLFVTGVILQIIPIGLVYFPLGLAGLAVLGASLSGAAARSRRIRRSALRAPEVIRRWSGDYLLNLVAFALALEQKGIAVVFIAVTRRMSGTALWLSLGAFSLVLWATVLLLARRERRGCSLATAGVAG